ncbi:MAG: helix-turn-helix transcriptional regulator [Microcoleaceae cyanobacterium]
MNTNFRKTPKQMMNFQEMLRYLLSQGKTPEAAHKVLNPNYESVNEIIFESNVDGVHYYLVRARPKPDQLMNLSTREQEIAKLVAAGLPNKCIAKQLGISPWTVATHLRRIFGKLGVTSRAAMVAKVLGDDLLTV